MESSSVDEGLGQGCLPAFEESTPAPQPATAKKLSTSWLRRSCSWATRGITTPSHCSGQARRGGPPGGTLPSRAGPAPSTTAEHVPRLLPPFSWAPRLGPLPAPKLLPPNLKWAPFLVQIPPPATAPLPPSIPGGQVPGVFKDSQVEIHKWEEAKAVDSEPRMARAPLRGLSRTSKAGPGGGKLSGAKRKSSGRPSGGRRPESYGIALGKRIGLSLVGPELAVPAKDKP